MDTTQIDWWPQHIWMHMLIIDSVFVEVGKRIEEVEKACAGKKIGAVGFCCRRPTTVAEGMLCRKHLWLPKCITRNAGLTKAPIFNRLQSASCFRLRDFLNSLWRQGLAKKALMKWRHAQRTRGTQKHIGTMYIICIYIYIHRSMNLLIRREFLNNSSTCSMLDFVDSPLVLGPWPKAHDPQVQLTT